MQCTRVQDSLADVRQSAFALLGDLAKTCADHLRPVLLQFAGLAAAQLEAAMITPQTMPACNNACWSLGAAALCQTR